ncbi:phage tail sheath C-terminal domain-containing protein [Pseudogulbenkiania ferrooxidans]|uniref:Mu tail sheath family protein n=1 Tax=Pseudogulbenkiania ferrooxidans 2002 TaxID=279714 RepID=B9Z4Z8_9NEIS|nr:phage tail sheath C-terminal domain-containing protein [Pseudogulbenkiania ferrooxidans]EEG08230.1 Mu tail sheath family protein [Pseudogulbenkiania ferrooxidans 2002]
MPDTTTFMTIPVGIRAGGVFVEIDHTQAVNGLPQMERKLLLLGQRLTGGTVPALSPVRVLNAEQAAGQFGRGSMLHAMAGALDKVKALYGLIDVWAVALDDLPAGAAATGTITLTGTVTKAGVMTLYIGGVRVRAQASLNDTNAQLATKVADAVNANADLPVTASADAGVVTITARHKGEASNGMELSTAYYDEDALPEGITAVCVNLADGAGNPDVADALAAISEDWFYSLVSPYTDSANLAAIEADLDGRWGGMDMRTGHVFDAKDGTHAQLTTWGAGRNSPHGTSWGLKACPTWAPVRAAAFAGVCEYHGAIDPALPLRNVEVPGVLAPRLKDRFSFNERELLLRDGISTTKVDSGGKVFLERVITNYQKNPMGVDDESLLRLETKWTADYFRYAVRTRIALRFPRHKLADDGISVAPGQKLVTPAIIRAELVGLHRELEFAGIVENTEQFKKDLLVVRSSADVDRVNAVLPPNLVNQFVTFAAAVQYRL